MTLTANALNLTLQVGDPTSDGVFGLAFQQRDLVTMQLNTVVVDVFIPAANDAQDKANDIVLAINGINPSPGFEARRLGNLISIFDSDAKPPANQSDLKTVVGITLTQEGTGEFDSVDFGPDLVNLAKSKFDDALSAFDASGQPSCFEAGIQTLVDPATGAEALLDAFACSGEIIASEGDLSGFSVASFLLDDLEFQRESLFNDLGFVLPYSAVLSEGSGIITFNFTEPTPAKLFFGTSSPTGMVSGSLSMVPEPCSLVLLLFGLVCIVRPSP